MKCFYCNGDLPLGLKEFVRDVKVGRDSCHPCFETIQEIYKMLYDPKYKDKETEEHESLDALLTSEFDEDGYLDTLNIPSENYDE